MNTGNLSGGKIRFTMAATHHREMLPVCLVTNGETSGRDCKSQTNTLFNYCPQLLGAARTKITFRDTEKCLVQKRRASMLSRRTTRRENISTTHYEVSHKTKLS